MEDFDIQEFAKMFDAALASDNPGVKKALRNFMMVAAIVHSQEDDDDERLAGPFETILKQLADLQRQVSSIERQRHSTTATYPSSPYDNTWVYTGSNPYTTSTTSYTTSVKDWGDDFSNIDNHSVDIQEYLNAALLGKKQYNE
jgi:hypothetical protein